MRNFVLGTMLLFFLCGCKNRSSTEILDRNKMEAVMWDFIQANAYTEQFTKRDSLKNASIENIKLQRQIFAIHNISKEQFYKSYTYYTTHADLMKTILDSITAKKERLRPEMIKIQTSLKATKL